MIIIKGSKKEEFTKLDLTNLINEFDAVYIDLGTGDGRFTYKNALKAPKALYIGIDPSQKQLEIYAKKASKDKLTNALFVLGSVELLPPELFRTANKVFINFPWGTLLQSVIKPTDNLTNIGKLLKSGGEIEIILGYSQETEPTEYERLQLTKIDSTELNSNFFGSSWKLLETTKLEKENLKSLESTWSKKLAYGKDRPLFILRMRPLTQ